MTREEFEMNLLIGGWTKSNGEDHNNIDALFSHVNSEYSMGVKDDSDKVQVYLNGNTFGATDYEEAFTTIHEHMVLIQEITNGQSRVFT